MILSMTYRDVNQAYFELQTIKNQFCKWEETRNGKAFVFQTPVCVTTTTPSCRVLFDSKRDANPFFHYMEALWMMAGRNHVSFPAHFAKNILNYSDEGKFLHGAYGYRWRNQFGMDQVETAIQMLKRDHTTRRVVIAMWDPRHDLEINSKDLPCNTHIYFRIQDHRLDMTVCNRSNDLVWGMMGSNIVHFSVLHEYIANGVGVDLGNLHQFTNNLHVYKEFVDKYMLFSEDTWYLDHPDFQRTAFSPQTLDLEELDDFVDLEERIYRCPIIRDNAVPMMDAWRAYKADSLPEAIHVAGRIHDEDWRKGCKEWLERRRDARLGSSGGPSEYSATE